MCSQDEERCQIEGRWPQNKIYTPSVLRGILCIKWTLLFFPLGYIAPSAGCMWLCSCSGRGDPSTNLPTTLPLRHLEHGSCMYNWRAQWKKGITVFDDSKRSKVNEAFSLSSKLLWLKFNSWICVLLKSSLVIFLDTKKLLLTFDLLGLSKPVIPFFHWALQLCRLRHLIIF